jgi:hypothetical protein
MADPDLVARNLSGYMQGGSQAAPCHALGTRGCFVVDILSCRVASVLAFAEHACTVGLLAADNEATIHSII